MKHEAEWRVINQQVPLIGNCADFIQFFLLFAVKWLQLQLNCTQYMEKGETCMWFVRVQPLLWREEGDGTEIGFQWALSTPALPLWCSPCFRAKRACWGGNGPLGCLNPEPRHFFFLFFFFYSPKTDRNHNWLQVNPFQFSPSAFYLSSRGGYLWNVARIIAHLSYCWLIFLGNWYYK